jgi:hypothetical protein
VLEANFCQVLKAMDGGSRTSENMSLVDMDEATFRQLGHAHVVDSLRSAGKLHS